MKSIKDIKYKYPIITIGIISLMFFPFLIEKIIYCESVFPFNLTIKFSKEIWFCFIASYIGAICTVFLGVISVWQNKRYKKLADESSIKMDETLNRIEKIIWQNSIPITKLENNYIIQTTVNKPIKQLHPHWTLSHMDDFSHLKYIFSDLEKENNNLYLLRKYRLKISNLSNFPIQNIYPVKLIIRDNTNQSRKFKSAADLLGGYISSNSSKFCELEIYDLIENENKYKMDKLFIELTIQIEDSKGYKHNKFFQFVSLTNNPYKNHDDIKEIKWSPIIILSTNIINLK